MLLIVAIMLAFLLTTVQHFYDECYIRWMLYARLFTFPVIFRNRPHIWCSIACFLFIASKHFFCSLLLLSQYTTSIVFFVYSFLFSLSFFIILLFHLCALLRQPTTARVIKFLKRLSDALSLGVWIAPWSFYIFLFVVVVVNIYGVTLIRVVICTSLPAFARNLPFVSVV